MPKGIYPRTENQLKASVKNLALGRLPKAREKARKKLIEKAKDPQWIERVSEGTKKAMQQPTVRKKHLRGLKKAREKYGVNFRGGNGQIPTPIIRLANKLFSKCGFERELAIKTKSVRHLFQNIPEAYKVDFGNTERKIVIEMDGICHHSMERKRLDKKKNKVLRALGWKVLRLYHQGT